jgi:hypothetical protein
MSAREWIRFAAWWLLVGNFLAVALNLLGVIR